MVFIIKLTTLEKQRFVKFLAVAAISSIICAIFIKKDVLIYRLVDGLFLGGMIVSAIGGFELSKKLGMFDLFLFSHKKLKKYSPKNHDIEEENDKETYYEYLSNKGKNNNYIIPLTIGLSFILVSIILTFIN